MKFPIKIWLSPWHRFSLHRGIGWSYAYKTGGPILKDEPHKWKCLNGFWVGTKHRSYWFLFRRHGLLHSGCWHFWRTSNWNNRLCWKCHDRRVDGR